MWFKSITLLTMPADFDIGLPELEHALAARPLRSPGPLEMETRGFVSPFARDDAAMTHGTDGATLFCLGEDSRLLPASVFNDALAERDETIAALTLRAEQAERAVELAEGEIEELRSQLAELAADRDEIHRALLMTTDERNRGDRDLHRLRTQLRDPVAVHVAMLRGEIAVPPLVRRIVRERDALRAKLAEYEQAPTVAYLSIDCVGERYLIFSQPQDKDELQELIARPTRKDGE